MSLKKQTVSGIKWLVGASFLQKGIQLCGTIILARILGPADFGLFALAFVAIDALGLFKSMGYDSALIQRKEQIEKATNTAFLIIPILGIALYLILAISAPLIARFLNNQQLVSVIRALGLIFVISCFGRVPAALMEKHMLFKQVSIIEISSATVFTASAIILAFLRFGVWSLVYAYILKTINQNILTFIYAKWKPTFEFDKKIALEMFNFGKFLFLTGIVWFLRMNLDNILVAKILGVTSLGLYAIAFNSSNIGADYFASKVYRVIFPAYSQIQNNILELQKATLKVLKYLNVIALPLSIVFLLLGKEFLFLIYGQKWLGATNALRILSFSGYFSTIAASLGPIFYACGKPKISFFAIVFQVLSFLIFIAPTAKLFGVTGVAIVVTVSCLISFFVTFIWAIRLISLKPMEIFYTTKSSFIAAFFMGTAIIMFKIILAYYQIEFLNSYLIATILLFASLLYLAILGLIDRLFLQNLKENIFSNPKGVLCQN